MNPLSQFTSSVILDSLTWDMAHKLFKLVVCKELSGFLEIQNKISVNPESGDITYQPCLTLSLLTGKFLPLRVGQKWEKISNIFLHLSHSVGFRKSNLTFQPTVLPAKIYDHIIF